MARAMSGRTSLVCASEFGVVRTSVGGGREAVQLGEFDQAIERRHLVVVMRHHHLRVPLEREEATAIGRFDGFDRAVGAPRHRGEAISDIFQ